MPIDYHLFPLFKDPFAALNADTSHLMHDDVSSVLLFSNFSIFIQLTTELNNEISDQQCDGNSDASRSDDWRASLEALGYLFNGLPSNPHWNLSDHQTIASLLKFSNYEAKMLSDM